MGAGENGQITLKAFQEAAKFVDWAPPGFRNTIRIKVLTVKERVELSAAVKGLDPLQINCELLRHTVPIFADSTDEAIGDLGGPVGAVVDESMRLNGFKEDTARKNG